jgi:hypothetical protein
MSTENLSLLSKIAAPIVQWFGVIGFCLWLGWTASSLKTQNEADHKNITATLQLLVENQKAAWTVDDMALLYANTSYWTNFSKISFQERMILIRRLHEENNR